MLNVSLRCLEVFVTTVEAKSFSAASEVLDISQPSVSAHVLALERDVGGQLFTRRRGARPLLTDVGETVYQHARQLLSEARDLRADVVTQHGTGSTRLVLSCQRSLANYVLDGLLSEFALRNRAIQMVVRIGKQEEVIADMREGRSDIGCFLSNHEPRGLVSEVIGHQRLAFIAAPTHPLAGRRNVPAAELALCDFVGPPPGSMFGRAITGLLSSIGVSQPRVVAQATEYQFLCRLVAASVGIACSPRTSAEADIAAGRLCALDVQAPPLDLDIRLLSSPYRSETPQRRQLRRYLKENLTPQAAELAPSPDLPADRSSP